ncbi:hypothetical protein MCP_0076 [Methanocella paludicola SANAE]|uniref:Uncharacterized protein n=1 Tax=Methanocella paludicola (strain DSM 17711 / JCM 13418 / NBRC 101707 / SANAE) TaxID=304371 RepID=D1YUM6_METPS|nr:hypothetical protein [Methanocella paludicola]BAI60148.1 hypothetical protein MCP_0076 [Methanocella paludicola SANAE]
MKLRNIVVPVLIGLFLASAALLTASAQYARPASDQILVNQPYGSMQDNILPPASFEQQQYPFAASPLAAPYGALEAPPVAPCAAPLAAPCAAPVATYGPFTSGFTYSATRSSAFGPFAPPVAEATEQFYQYPGISPYGAYPGAGYAAASGVGFDPATGYYGPYGAYTPLI